MAIFNVVETDCGGDVTANFDLMVESGSTLYQIHTVATISPHGQVFENPAVQACGCNDVVCVAADSQVLLFQEECRKFLFSVGLDCLVDCVACNEQGDFLAVGDRGGGLHFMATAFQHTLISQQLIETNKLTSREQVTFIHIVFTAMSDEGACDLLVLAACGQVYHFQNLQLRQLKQALISKDVVRLRDLQKDIRVDMFDAMFAHSETTLYVHCLPPSVGSSILTAGAGETVLAMWNKTGEGYVCSKTAPPALAKDCAVTKVAVTKCGKSLFTLDSESHLMLWSTHTLTCMRQWNDSVTDFSLQETAQETTGVDGLKIVMLTMDQDGACSLQICSLPRLEPVCRLQLNKTAWLVSCPPSQESVLLVEGAAEETSSLGDHGDLIENLKVCCLTETLPETRFYKLLSKKLFDGAESFAKLFNLDVELVYKTKANYILDQLSLWGDSSLTPQADGDLLVQLKLCLVNIQDDGNIVECCIKAPLSNARDVFDLLNFARNRLENSQQVGNGKTLCEVERSDLLTKVLEMLHRLNTFIITFGVQHFTGERWEEFRKVCLLRESLRYLSLGHISKVVCLWSRHPREFEATMSCVVVEDMLANISAETPSKLLTCWLTGHLIPVIVRQCPAALSTLVSWLEQRARNLEILEKDDWPHNALHLCDLPVLQQFTSGDCDLRIASEILKEQLDDPTGAFKRLAALILHLREFIRFCSQYNCHLSFTEYLQETTETVAYRMLDRITATELIPDFIANTIRPYMAEHGLDDRILYQYVKSLTEWSFKMSLQLQETIWEVKAISIIGCIQNHNYKMDAILDVILKACIPWSSAMEELVKDGLGMKHPRVPELHERCRLVELRKMLYSYDLGHYNVSEPSNAQRLVYHIVSRDRVTAVSDALEVVKAYSHLTEDSVYLFRLRYLIDHHRHAESMELLHSLPQHQQVTCGKQLVIGTRLLLRNDGIVFNQQNTNALSLLHTRSSCDILQHLLTLDLSADDQEHFEELLSNLKNIHVLQVEFGEFVSYEDYCSDDMRQEMCKERLSERHASMRDFGERKPGLAAPSDCRVYRQAQVLRINRDVLYGQRTLDAIKMGNIDEAIHWCRLLCRSLPTQESAERMFDTARHLCSLLATQEREEVHLQKGLPWVVTDLASQAVTYCSADLLTDCLQLCRSTYLASDVLRQCQTEDYNVSIQRAAGGRQGTAGKDPFIEWVFDDYFQEDGLVMEASQVLASLYHYTVASVPAHSVRDDKSTLQQLASAVTPVISHLKDNGHLSLAVQYCQETVTTMMQHVTSQAMGFTDLSPPVKQQQTIDMELLKTIVPPSLAEISLMTSSLLMKVLSHWPVDHALVVGLLCNLPHKLALEILQKATKKLGFHYKHILAVVRAGKDFADMCREQKTYDAYQLLEMDAYWGHKLAKCKVSFKGVFGLSRIEKRQLLPQICRSRTVHATSIRQFCSDYALDEDEPLMMHLKHLLGQCAVVSPGGTAMQAIDHTLVTSLLSAATELIEDFHNTELLLWSLQKILPQIDPYDYTRLEFVLKHMSNISSDPSVKKHEKLLSFLCEYKRVAPPSSYELNYNTGDTKMVIENRALPAVADTRLPFHPLASGAPWKIISPELNADTLSVWLSVISLLQLSPNQLYITVIHNIVNMHLETSRDRELASRSQDSGGQVSQSSDSGFDASFLDTVQSFLLKMTSAETAVGCSNWVVKELPLGREKVAVAKFNMQLSVKWHQSAATEAERLERKEIHGKIFERYRRLATEQLLHALHLTHPDLLQLTHSPVKLIFHLYQHHSVLTQSMGSWVSCQPDIHKVADEIGDINQVNVNKIRLNLIEKWFRSTTQAKQDDLDVTLDATMCQTDDLEKYEDDSNLMRANYLLQYGPAETSTKFLLGLAFAENTSKISHLCRVRALRCLFSLTDSNTIERLSRMTLDHIRDVMCGLHYIVVLEQLQMSQTLKSFSKCNKLGLIKTILRSHSHKARAVRLAAELCLEYSIFEVQLWSNILKQLLAFHMLDFLQHVLIRLLPVSTLWQGSGIMAVWKGILMAPLLSAVTPVSGGPLHDCLGSLVLLHRCPLLQDLDLATFSRRYLQLDLPVCAVACAMLIPPSDSRTACLRQVLTPATVTRLHQQLGEWTLQSSIDPMVQQLLLSLWHLEEDVEDLLSDKSQLVVDH